MRQALVVVSVVMLSGCAAARLYPASAVNLVSPAEPGSRCVERLLARSRTTGYIEQTVDKDMGFFRVMSQTYPLFQERTFAKDVEKQREAAEKNKRLLARVEFYNVQCTGPEAVVVTPMSSTGGLDGRYVLNEWQHAELERYTTALAPPPPVVVAPPPEAAPAVRQPGPPKCVAAELPEWAGASATKKKELMDRCRGE